jgi:DNA-binding transcriptional LysR family regulator
MFDESLDTDVFQNLLRCLFVDGYTPYVDLRFMTELKEVVQGEPETLSVSFESASSEDIAQRVQNRDWDCGILVLPLAMPDVDIVPLFVLPLSGAMQKTHRLARRRTLSLEDLEDENLILKCHDPHFREWLLSQLADAGIKARLVTEASNPHEAQFLVARGSGIALANSGAFRNCLEKVVVRSFQLDSVPMQTALVVKKGRHSSTVTAFIKKVVQTARMRGHGRLAMRSVA